MELGGAIRVLLATGMAWGLLSTLEQPTLGLTLESPEVRAVIAKGIAFLESNAANDSRLGAQALVGLALLKAGASPDHTKVVQAATAIKNAVNAAKPTALQMDIYSAGLSVVFLVALDPSRYSAEIVALLRYLESIQKPHGGWGYPDKPTGDTSMTQYAVLSSWEAKQVGLEVPSKMIERVAEWLLRTQDPGGGFGYQGQVAGSLDAPVKQNGISLSMTSAGLGSVYLCAELLGLVEPADDDADLPPALKKVKKQDAQRQTRQTAVAMKVLREIQSRGNRWMAANYKIKQDTWSYYYLDALEQVLDAIDDPENPDFSQAVAAIAELPPEAGKILLSKHARKLRELAGGSSPEARVAAIRALAKTGNLNHVSTLIYALADPDPDVMREARTGLERLSRKFTGFGPPDRPTNEQRRQAIDAWKGWLRTVRPGAEFED